MRTALIVGATTVTAAAGGLAAFLLFQDSNTGKVDEEVATALKGNEKLFGSKELALIKKLLTQGQSHLFAAWPAPGTSDALKHKVVAQLMALDASYHGGLSAYIENARKLLQDSKEGRNPFDGYTPSVPHGERLDFMSQEFIELEKDGLAEAAHTAFVLVAGGLGERLGYSGIKVALPCESASGWSFLELYARYIKALQISSGTTKRLPFAIMTSDDTHARTLSLLESHKYFGLEKSQVHLIKQEKVACLIDNDATLALDPTDSFAVQTKPHGHGDVHALLHSSGLAKKWHSHGFKWVAFFQDTNALVIRALTTALGVSARHDYDMNSLAVPRKAKESIGAIACLKHTDGSTLTINVEYNQLDPLLRSTVSPQGDVNDASGWSPYPGNINQLIIKLDSYVHQLHRTGGIISEFVNPKYKDATKTAFKSSTRLECMMQDYPKALPAGSKVGFTTINQVWASYSPVKNNPADALAKAKEGNPTHSATTGEMDIYEVNCQMLQQLAGARVPALESATFNGIPVSMYPHVALSPEFATVVTDVDKKIEWGALGLNIGAVLVLDGESIQVKGPVEVKGALVIRAVAGAHVLVGALKVDNAGWTWQPLAEGEAAKEEERIRGFRVIKTETAEYIFDKPGCYTVGQITPPPALDPVPAGSQDSLSAPPAAGGLAPPPTPASILTPNLSTKDELPTPPNATGTPVAAQSSPLAPSTPRELPTALPAAPAAPAEPAMPATPAAPAEPSVPAAPAEPAEPSVPAAPAALAEPSVPAAPAESVPAAPAVVSQLSAAAPVFTPSFAPAATTQPVAAAGNGSAGDEDDDEGDEEVSAATGTSGAVAGSALPSSGAGGASTASKKKKKKKSKK